MEDKRRRLLSLIELKLINDRPEPEIIPLIEDFLETFGLELSEKENKAEIVIKPAIMMRVIIGLEEALKTLKTTIPPIDKASIIFTYYEQIIEDNIEVVDIENHIRVYIINVMLVEELKRGNKSLLTGISRLICGCKRRRNEK